jgi:hypothetical protein
MPRLRRPLALVAASALLAFAFIAIAQASVVGVPTKLTIADSFPAFHGKVKSQRGVCERNRKVKLFQEQSGNDDLLGSDRSNPDGKWKVPISPGSGAYYAKVTIKTKIDENSNGVSCHKDHSRTIVID